MSMTVYHKSGLLRWKVKNPRRKSIFKALPPMELILWAAVGALLAVCLYLNHERKAWRSEAMDHNVQLSPPFPSNTTK